VRDDELALAPSESAEGSVRVVASRLPVSERAQAVARGLVKSHGWALEKKEHMNDLSRSEELGDGWILLGIENSRNLPVETGGSCRDSLVILQG